MNDIRPPAPRQQPSSVPLPPETPPAAPVPAEQVVQTTDLSLESPPPKKKMPKLWKILGAVLLAIIAACAAVYLWYASQLQPVEPGNTQTVRLEVKTGMGPQAIAKTLRENGVIHSQIAFEWYVRLEGVGNSLRAGTYALNKSMNMEEIVGHLQKGQTDTFRITFYPGAVLKDTTSTPEQKKTDATTMLRRAGYTDAEIAAGLSATYNHPLLASKPASADLEGYIYGETYEFSSSASVEDILRRTFDQMYAVVEQHDLVNKYKKRGLSLYEGITMASIIQREVNGASDQQKVAGVFYNRLKQGMTLGSDVTYQYIADKTGQARSPDLDSKYNTRKYTGLPPGPIAVPGESALIAAAQPAKHSYLYFLSGDDDKTYFGRTQAEHDRNIQQHCQLKCQIL